MKATKKQIDYIRELMGKAGKNNHKELEQSYSLLSAETEISRLKGIIPCSDKQLFYIQDLLAAAKEKYRKDYDEDYTFVLQTRLSMKDAETLIDDLRWFLATQLRNRPIIKGLDGFESLERTRLKDQVSHICQYVDFPPYEKLI
jgi:hypothetical protein